MVGVSSVYLHERVISYRLLCIAFLCEISQAALKNINMVDEREEDHWISVFEFMLGNATGSAFLPSLFEFDSYSGSAINNHENPQRGSSAVTVRGTGELNLNWLQDIDWLLNWS